MKAKILFSFTTALFLPGVRPPKRTFTLTATISALASIVIMDNELESEGDRTGAGLADASRIREGAWVPNISGGPYECVKQAGGSTSGLAKRSS